MKKDKYVLYPKFEYKDFRINISNTFKYLNLEKYPNNFRSTDEHFETIKVLKKIRKKPNYL